MAFAELLTLIWKVITKGTKEIKEHPEVIELWKTHKRMVKVLILLVAIILSGWFVFRICKYKTRCDTVSVVDSYIDQLNNGEWGKAYNSLTRNCQCPAEFCGDEGKLKKYGETKCMKCSLESFINGYNGTCHYSVIFREDITEDIGDISVGGSKSTFDKLADELKKQLYDAFPFAFPQGKVRRYILLILETEKNVNECIKNQTEINDDLSTRHEYNVQQMALVREDGEWKIDIYRNHVNGYFFSADGSGRIFKIPDKWKFFRKAAQ
jgi:hypothetical protein